MKVTAKLIWYATVLHSPKGHTVRLGEREGEVNCRVRTYLHEDDQPCTDGEAIREESVILLDTDLTERAEDRGAGTWDTGDLLKSLAEKLNKDVE